MEKDTEAANGNINPPRDYNDPSSKLWSIYFNEASQYDKALVESWTKVMDGILIFSGLFSAVITAFIIDGYKQLSRDSASITIDLLAQISQQLAGASNGSHVAALVPPQSFRPTSTAVRVNVLWFLSLALGLTCALSATLVQQSSRNYIQVVNRRHAPHIKGPIRAFLHEGIERFRMRAVVEFIPTLLHIAVFLFLVGLVDYLFVINTIIAGTILGITVIWAAFYIIVTILPVIYLDCPYYTPLSDICWRIMHMVFYTKPQYNLGNSYVKSWRNLVKGSISDAQVSQEVYHSRDRTIRALQWTILSLTEDTEFEPFVGGLSHLLSFEMTVDKKEDVKDTILPLIFDPEIKLLSRVSSLLDDGSRTGKERDGLLIRRNIICMQAIAYLISILDSKAPESYQIIFSTSRDLAKCLAELKQSKEPDMILIANSITQVLLPKLQELTVRMIHEDSNLHALVRRGAAWFLVGALDALNSVDFILGIIPTIMFDELSEYNFGTTFISEFQLELLPRYLDEHCNSSTGFLATADRQAYIMACLNAIYLTTNYKTLQFSHPIAITKALVGWQNNSAPLLTHYANCVNARYACHLQGCIVSPLPWDYQTAEIPSCIHALSELCVLDNLPVDGEQDLQRELTLWYFDMKYHARSFPRFWAAVEKKLSEYTSMMLPDELESLREFQGHATGGKVKPDFQSPEIIFLSQGYTAVLVIFLTSMRKSPLPDDVLEPALDTLELITRNLTARFSSLTTQRCLIDLVGEVTNTLLADLVSRAELNPPDEAGLISTELERLPSNISLATSPTRSFESMPRNRRDGPFLLSEWRPLKFSHPIIRATHNERVFSSMAQLDVYSRPVVRPPSLQDQEELECHGPKDIIRNMIHTLLQILSTLAHPDCIEDAQKTVRRIHDSPGSPDLVRRAAQDALLKLAKTNRFEFSISGVKFRNRGNLLTYTPRPLPGAYASTDRMSSVTPERTADQVSSIRSGARTSSIDQVSSINPARNSDVDE